MPSIPTTWQTGLNRPARGIFAVDVNAWNQAGEASASTWASRLDFAVFHAPETGNDETFRQAMETARPAFKSLCYCEWGFSLPDAYTTGMGSTTATSEGWHATINSVNPVVSPYYANYYLIDAGKSGWGLRIANLVISRMQALSGAAYDGVFFDDVNCFIEGVANFAKPDGYATITAYKDAVKAQLAIAVTTLANAGYLTTVNLGGLYSWRPESAPSLDLVGVAQVTHNEFTGGWQNGDVILTDATISQKMIDAGQLAKTRNNVINFADYTGMPNLFNDYLARILGEPGYVAANYGNVIGPFPWHADFLLDYGTPTGAISRAGNVWSRSFSNGIMLTVNVSTKTYSKTVIPAVYSKTGALSPTTRISGASKYPFKKPGSLLAGIRVSGASLKTLPSGLYIKAGSLSPRVSASGLHASSTNKIGSLRTRPNISGVVARTPTIVPIVPGRPIVSEVAEELYEILRPVAYNDQALGWPLLLYCEAVAGNVQVVKDYGEDWSAILDVDRCPHDALAWLSQFVGSYVDPNHPGESHEDHATRARAYIRATPGFQRGTAAAMTAAIQQHLTGTQTVKIRERQGGPYKLEVRTKTNETPSTALVLESISWQKPAGLVLDYATVIGQEYVDVFTGYATYQAVYNAYRTYNGLYLGVPGT